jgi:hypothetical protein
LNLNHQELVTERIAALSAFGLGDKATKPLRTRAAERLSRQIAQRNAEGVFEPFCVAIQQAAAREAQKAARRSARLRSTR